MLSNEDYAQDDPRFGKVHVDNNGFKVRMGLNEAYDNPGLGFYDESVTTVQQALVLANLFYQNQYWFILKGDQLTDQAVASKIFDMAVNVGKKESVTLLQRVVYGVPLGAYTSDVDGKMGPQTLRKVNALDGLNVVRGLIDQWEWFITQEIKNKPHDKENENGWRARAQKIPPEI